MNKEKQFTYAGSIVGEEAIPIGTTNKGNQLLRAMGWKGGPLGPQGKGIQVPVEAIYKSARNKSGLGFPFRNSSYEN
jgi:hypothetical protein